MKKFLMLPILLGALLGFAVAHPTHAAANSPESLAALKLEQHKAAHTIILKNSGTKIPKSSEKTSNITPDDAAGCSATAIGEHVLLTAQHCDIKDGLLYLDQDHAGQKPIKISEKYYDKNDHMLLVVPDVTFKYYVKYDASKVRSADQGEHVYLFGNPALIMDQYREGYATGITQIPGNEMPDEVNASGPFTMMSLSIVGGDSGSSVYSSVDGQLVGITTWGINGGMFLGSYPLIFSQAQVDQALGQGTFVYAPEPAQPVQPVIVVNVPPSATTPASKKDYSLHVVVVIALLLYKGRDILGFLAKHTRNAFGFPRKVVSYIARLFLTVWAGLKKI